MCSCPQLQAVAAPQCACQDNRGAGADVHPNVAAAGVCPGGARGRQRPLHRRLGRPHPLRLAGVDDSDGRAVVPEHAQPVTAAEVTGARARSPGVFLGQGTSSNGGFVMKE